MSASRHHFSEADRAAARSSTYHTDRHADIRDVVGGLLSVVQAEPEPRLIEMFVGVAGSAGIATSRWRGRAEGLVRQMLRELERDGRALRFHDAGATNDRERTSWAAPGFKVKPPKPERVPRAPRVRAPAPDKKHATTPRDCTAAVAMLRQEITDVRARLNRMEAQLAAMVASNGRD